MLAEVSTVVAIASNTSNRRSTESSLRIPPEALVATSGTSR